MIELEPTKGKRITIPKKVKRYGVVYYSVAEGWRQGGFGFYTTPESALEDFLRMYSKTPQNDYAPKFYSVYELDLEISVL